MSDSEINESLNDLGISDDISARHKKERKNMLAQIQSLKKTAGKGDKKKKKEVLEEIARLEADLDRRHEEELASANAFRPSRSQPDESAEADIEEAEDNDSTPSSGNRVSKAQKRRDKKAKEEKERQAEILIQEELNKDGPRMVEMGAIKTLLKSRKLVVHPISSDGDCLYNAIRHQLDLTGRKPIDTVTLRRLTAEYIRANKDSLIFYMSNPDTGDGLTDAEFEKYCESVQNTKAWGGHIEIKAVSEILQAPIEVLQATGPPTIQGESQFRKPNLVITYHRHIYSLGEHYNSTRLASAADDDENSPSDGK